MSSSALQLTVSPSQFRRSGRKTSLSSSFRILRMRVSSWKDATHIRLRTSAAMPQADMFHQVRSQYERSMESRLRHRLTHEHGDPRKVLARSEESFITELPDKWRIDYDRRKGHSHTGLYALANVPYKSFGNLKHTDAYDLLCEHLDVSVGRQCCAKVSRASARWPLEDTCTQFPVVLSL